MESSNHPTTNGTSPRSRTHAANLCGAPVESSPKTEAERQAARTASLLPNLRANAQMVAPDLPEPAAVGYLLLLFDQCRACDLTHEQLVSVFDRPLLAFLDLTLQAVEKLAARSGIGRGAQEEVEEAPPCAGRWLTPYQLARLRDIAGEYVSALPDPRAREALLLLYDLFEIFALSPGQCETVFGTEALRHLTELVCGERRQDENQGEATQYDLPAPAAPRTQCIRIGGHAIPLVGTVGEGGRVTYAPEARLWLRYIGAGRRGLDAGAGSTQEGAA
jgi:hypothetical protein